MLKITLNGLLAAIILVVPIGLKAQVNPVCREVAADADGDGFGWQDDASCIVTQESEPAPVYLNLETNAYVNLTRAYWNPPTDLYNKTITCIAHYFETDSGTYVADNDPSRETHYSFHYTHFPLTTSPPYSGTVRSEHIVAPAPWNDSFETYYDVSLVNWSMDNGIYTGGAPFSSSPYVEIITEETTNQSAIRTWGLYNTNYVQCSTAPTGAPPSLDSGVDETDTTEAGNGETADQVNDQVIADNTDTPDSTNNNNTSTDNGNALIASDATNTAATITQSSGGGSIGLFLLTLLVVIRRALLLSR